MISIDISGFVYQLLFDQIVLDIIDIDNEITSLVYGNLNEKEIWEVLHMNEYEKHKKSNHIIQHICLFAFLLSRFSLQNTEAASNG